MTDGFAHHGGRLAEACARFGGEPGDWLDLSTGINPRAWSPPSALQVDWLALPDPLALLRLEQAAAAAFGCPPDMCAGVPGSETGLRQIARLLGLPGLCLPLAYGTYRAAFGQGAEVENLAQLPERASALVLGNPNNPDGELTSRARLNALLAHQERHGGWLIVDEAFADCDPSWSIAHEVAPGRRLIVLRSFGKFFGLAGLRLGFVIAPPQVLLALRSALGDWPLHAAALSYATAAYADRDWQDETRRSLLTQQRALDSVLRRHGLSPRGDCPLFRLIAASRAGELFLPLASRNILVRPFDGRPDLLRLGLPGCEAGLDWLDSALEEIVRHG